MTDDYDPRLPKVATRGWLRLSRWAGGVYGPYVDVRVDTIVALEHFDDKDHARMRTVLYFVGGSTMKVCEPPNEVVRRIAQLTDPEAEFDQEGGTSKCPD